MSIEDELRAVFRDVDSHSVPDPWPSVRASMGRQRPRLRFNVLAAAVVATVVVAVVVGVGGLMRPMTSEPAGLGNASRAPGSSAPSNGSNFPSASPIPSLSPSGANTGALGISTSSPGSGGGDALTTGTLRGEVRGATACLWISAGSGDRTALVWPHGFSGHLDPFRVIGPDGQDLAQVGDTVALGGGGTPPGYQPTSAQDPCSIGRIFVVSSVVSVNGAPVNVGEGSLRLSTRGPGDPSTCPTTYLEPLMLVMVDGSLHLRAVADGSDLAATWPIGFTASPGARITVLDGAGSVVMTQGVEAADVRGFETPQGVDVCGVGDVAYP